jgi:Uma2 family endonuclease
LGHSPLPPDFAAEIVGPVDVHLDIEQKVEQFLAAGTPLFWVVDSVNRRVRVRRADGTVADLRGDAELSGEGVLPGFRCRVSDLFRAAAPRRPES